MNNISPLSHNLFSFIWYFVKSYQWAVFTFVIIGISCGFYGPVASLLIKYIINLLPTIESSRNISVLTWPAILFVLNFMILDNITWRSLSFINYKFLPIIKNKIITETFDFVLDHSNSFFQNNLSGRISNQINTLADNIENILLHNIGPLLRSFSVVIIASFSLYYVNPRFGLTLLIWSVIFCSIGSVMIKFLSNLSDKHVGAESVVAGQLTDAISNSSNIRIFARKNFEISRIYNFLLARKKTFQSLEGAEIIIAFIQGTLIAIMLGFQLYFLINLYGKGLVTIVDFALI